MPRGDLIFCGRVSESAGEFEDADCLNPGLHLLGAFAQALIVELFVVHLGHFDVDINTVYQWPGKAFLIAQKCAV